MLLVGSFIVKAACDSVLETKNWKQKSTFVSYSFNVSTQIENNFQLMNLKRVGRPTNESDRPTAITYIAVGKEWTPSKPIQELPLFIEVSLGGKPLYYIITGREKGEGANGITWRIT